MAIEKVSLKAICEMDGGRIALAVDQALARIARDIEDRPGDDRPRSVNLQISVKPNLDQDGMCDTTAALIQIKETIPTRKIPEYSFGLCKGGMLVHRSDNPNDVNQPGLFGQTASDDEE